MSGRYDGETCYECGSLGGLSLWGGVCVCYFPHDDGYVPARGLCVYSMPSNPRAPPFSHLGMWYTAGIQQQPSISTVGSSN